jgi:exonuclease SbcD
MRILHTADIHLGELTGPIVDGQNARMMDTIRCMDFLAAKAEQEKPDAILIAGDLFNKSKLWGEEMLREIGIAVEWLRRLAAVAPTVLMFGTETHENPRAFENILNHNIQDLYIVTKPEYLRVTTKSGSLQVAAVPGYDKGHFRAQQPGMDPTEENATCSKMLGDIILGLSTFVDPLIPSVLMSHYTVVGCQLDNGEHVFLQSDVVLPKEALAASPFNLVAMGHIHRAQEVEHCGRPVFYSGPINGITFNEEGQDKGFWMHELGKEAATSQNWGKCSWLYLGSEFVKTPSREFLTIKLDLRESADIESDLKWELAGIGPTNDTTLLMYPHPDKIVRVHYQCTDEQKKQINHKTMEQLLYTGGAFYVAEIRPVQVITTLSRQEMSENDGPLENLAAWLLAEGFSAEETERLVELAGPLVATVSAKMPSGKLSGVFIPKRIEVRNYRSYREESFDFSRINFATVNGPNGVGKSALFMDAVCDCLYEEPREGDLTGWISNDESIRSGSIMFEFCMGESDWRVTRTRAKSGKTTLALDELVNDKWEPRSCDKTRETQEKIIALLGMDAMTFRCCALIMQDAYGIFMEADKEDRMQVLANILGLNIYEQLTALAKAKATDTNRELTRAKEKLAELDEKLNAKAGLDAELADVNSSLTIVAHDIAEKEAALKEAEELVRQLTAKKERAEELQKQIAALANEIQGKEQEKTKCQEQLNWAEERLAREETILAKAAEYAQVKEQLTVLKTKQPQLNQVKSELSRVTDDVGKAILNIKKLDEQIGPIESVLANREELQKASQEYRETMVSLEGLDDLEKKWSALDFKVRGARDKWNSLLTKHAAKKTALETEIKTLTGKTEMLKDSGCIDTENATCKFLADAKAAKIRLTEVQAEYDGLDNSEVNELEQSFKVLSEELQNLNYDYQEHRRIKEAVAGLRPLAEQAAELNAKAELLKNLEEQRKQIDEQKCELQNKQANIADQIIDLEEELKPLTELETRLPKLEAWLKAKEELPVAKQMKEAANERLAALGQEIGIKDTERKKLDGERAELLIAASGLQTHKDDVDILSRQIKTFQEKQNELHSKAGGLKAKLEALQKDQEERDRIAAEMEPTAKLLVRYQTLSKAFGFDGIPFSIVRSVVPELSAMANEILGQMTGGKMSLEMRTEKVQKSNKNKEVNALEIWITDYQRGTLPYKSRSGGQKVKSALSVAFGLADLKARRAGIQLGMMFVDEPSFLDQEGTDAYCDALELLGQKYPNMKIIAISHDIRMISRFPQIIRVEDTGETGSKVRLVA